VTFGHEIFGELGGYFEFYNALPKFQADGWVATADVGLTYGLSKHVQLDAGANIGLSAAADQLNLFSGITARF
jgi:hypothetical protein